MTYSFIYWITITSIVYLIGMLITIPVFRKILKDDKKEITITHSLVQQWPATLIVLILFGIWGLLSRLYRFFH